MPSLARQPGESLEDWDARMAADGEARKPPVKTAAQMSDAERDAAWAELLRPAPYSPPGISTEADATEAGKDVGTTASTNQPPSAKPAVAMMAADMTDAQRMAAAASLGIPYYS